MKYANIYLALGGALLTGVLSAAIVRKKQNQKEYDKVFASIQGLGQTGSLGQDLSTDTSSLPNTPPPFNFGDSSRQIALLQQAMNRKYNSQLTINGTFDAALADELCVNYFHSCFGWYPDSIKQNYSVSQTDYDSILNG